MYELFNGDCLKLLKNIDDESIDAVVTDPPYQYLHTNHKNKLTAFDSPYNENEYIEELKRIIKPSGFVVMFGRGVPFYRQGVLLDKVGFIFKEEVVWNKYHFTSPCHTLKRKHELIYIFGKKKAKIKARYIPYIENVESKPYPIEEIKNDIKRIKAMLNNKVKFDQIIKYLEMGEVIFKNRRSNCVCHTGKLSRKKTPSERLDKIIKGLYETSVMDVYKKGNKLHPTEKPVRLMERLIAIVSEEDDLILDPFMGSGTTGEACINTNRRFIGMELDVNYFNIAKKRIEEVVKKRSEELPGLNYVANS